MLRVLLAAEIPGADRDVGDVDLPGRGICQVPGDSAVRNVVGAALSDELVNRPAEEKVRVPLLREASCGHVGTIGAMLALRKPPNGVSGLSFS